MSDLRDMVLRTLNLPLMGMSLLLAISKTFAQVFADFAAQTAERHRFVMLLDLVYDFNFQPRLQDLPS